MLCIFILIIVVGILMPFFNEKRFLCMIVKWLLSYIHLIDWFLTCLDLYVFILFERLLIDSFFLKIGILILSYCFVIAKYVCFNQTGMYFYVKLVDFAITRYFIHFNGYGSLK